jgi:hypothetical protein
MVRKCVSSKSKICELIPFQRCAQNVQTLFASEHSRLCWSGEWRQRCNRVVDCLVPRLAHGATDPVQQGSGTFSAHHGGDIVASRVHNVPNQL